MEELILTDEWDKTFAESSKVKHSKVTFHNRYGVTLAADMYVPRNTEGKLAAIAVSGPFGAVKEQASGLYAQTLAERGFLTIAFDPSFTGESGGTPRYMASSRQCMICPVLPQKDISTVRTARTNVTRYGRLSMHSGQKTTETAPIKEPEVSLIHFLKMLRSLSGTTMTTTKPKEDIMSDPSIRMTDGM